MEINEKKQKKEQRDVIIRKYQQYLKLEKSLSPNTLDAYLTDLDKLMSFLTLEEIDVLDVCLADLQRFAAGLHDIGIHPDHKPASYRESNHSSVFSSWQSIWKQTPANYWKVLK